MKALIKRNLLLYFRNKSGVFFFCIRCAYFFYPLPDLFKRNNDTGLAPTIAKQSVIGYLVD